MPRRLCRGWRVRDVAGHLALVPTITTWQMVSAAPRAGFDPNRINTLLAVRQGSDRPDEIVARSESTPASGVPRRMLDTRNSLFDAVVHSQDIARPLGRDFPVPVAFSRAGLARVWQMGWPFNARRNLAASP